MSGSMRSCAALPPELNPPRALNPRRAIKTVGVCSHDCQTNWTAAPKLPLVLRRFATIDPKPPFESCPGAFVRILAALKMAGTHVPRRCSAQHCDVSR